MFLSFFDRRLLCRHLNGNSFFIGQTKAFPIWREYRPLFQKYKKKMGSFNFF